MTFIVKFCFSLNKNPYNIIDRSTYLERLLNFAFIDVSFILKYLIIMFKQENKCM